MSDLDNVNSAFSVTVYKKLQKQISPLVEKLNQLEENTHLIETTPGPKGDKGIKGDQGIAGRDGERGLIGEQGIAGPQGKTGEQGLIGEQGLQGIQGDKGDKGDTGQQGIAGPQGVIGPQGIQGDKGDKGDTGQQGDKGDTGQQGIQGNPGKDGLTGKTGQQGIQGLKGDTGVKGDIGETGADGKPGPQGIQGETGPQGKAGIDGNDGKDAELPDIDKIIEPHLAEVKKEIDSYAIKSDKDFNNYRTIINKSISNMAGGGAVKISQLADVEQSTAKVDGNFLKYDGSTNKWVGVDIAAGAPEQLNTLNELAAALDDDENFATTVTNSIATKASQTDLDTHTGNTNNPHSVTATQVGLGSVEDKSSATIRSEIVESNIPSTITRDSELSAHTDLTNNPHSVTATQVGLGNVTNESKATMFTNPTFTGTISSSGLLDFGDRSSNDILINVESNSNDLTLFRAASTSDTVGIAIKYLGAGSGDENIFEISTDGGGSFKMDQSGDVGINTAPVDGVGLTTTSAKVNNNLDIGGTIKSGAYEPEDFPDTTSVRTTAAFKEDGTMVQDAKVIVKKVTGAEAKAMTFDTPSSWIEIIPTPGTNKVIVVREIEIFIDRGSWSPINSGVKGYGGDLQLIIKTPSNQSGFEYNTYAVLQKKFLNHTINNTYNASTAVDTIIVRDAPVSQTRAYPNVPLLLRPKNALTTSQLTTYNQTPDDDYYFRITYKIMDMISDFTPTTT
tara:strand:+ start:1400 stop:3595 length:2196 start_codon:yes stop_codon:yes gene_type:complete